MIALQGKKFIPEPLTVMPGLQIEHEIGGAKLYLPSWDRLMPPRERLPEETEEEHTKIRRAYAFVELWRIRRRVTGGTAGTASDVEWSRPWHTHPPLTVRAIPFIGYIDVVNRRDHWIDSNGDKHPMSSKQVELLDWKTSSDIAKFGKTDLAATTQMIGYAEWARRQWPDLEQFRLSHGYFQTKGRAAEKRTVLISLDTLDKQWQRVEEQVERMTQVARETDVTRIDPNYASCESFGWKGCPYKKLCPRSQQEVFDLFDSATNDTTDPGDPSDMTMNMMDMLLAAGGTNPAPTAPVTPALVAQPLPQGIPSQEAINAAMATLKAQEASAQAAAATPSAPSAPGCIVCGEALTATNTSTVPDGTVWHMTAAPHVGKRPGQVVITPPDVPASNPALAAQAVPAGTALTPAVDAAVAAHNAAVAAQAQTAAPSRQLEIPAATDAQAKDRASAVDRLVAAGVPRDAAVAAVNQMVGTSTPAVAAPATPAPAVVAQAAAAPATHTPPAPATSAPPATAGVGAETPKGRKKKGEAAPAMGTGALVLFVDCGLVRFAGVEVVELDEYIAELCAKLCVRTSGSSLEDIRLAPDGDILAYGKWKGALAAAIRHAPPTGFCRINVNNDEIKQVALSALLPLATGGVVLR